MYRDNLRAIKASLGAVPGQLYHMGARGTVSRSTLADANERWNWRIYTHFAQILIQEVRKPYDGSNFGINFKRKPSTHWPPPSIDLCLSLFPWAHFRRAKRAIKLHTLLDLCGSILTFVQVTDGSIDDLNILDELILKRRRSMS